MKEGRRGKQWAKGTRLQAKQQQQLVVMVVYLPNAAFPSSIHDTQTLFVCVCVFVILSQAVAELAYEAGIPEAALPVLTASHELSVDVGKVCFRVNHCVGVGVWWRGAGV